MNDVEKLFDFSFSENCLLLHPAEQKEIIHNYKSFFYVFASIFGLILEKHLLKGDGF